MPTATDQPNLLELLDPPKVKKVKRATAAELAIIAGDPASFRVPFGQLRISTNVRGDMTREIADLAASIRANGLLTPPGVREQAGDDGDPVWVVEVGHRRYLALRALGLKADDLVPVHPMTAVDGAARTVRQWEENQHRLDLTPMDEARTLQGLIDDDGMTNAAAAKALGLSGPVASKRRCLLHLPADGQAKVDAGEWDIEPAQIVGRLARDGYPETKVANLVGCQRWKAEDTAAAWKNKQAGAKLRRQLEARGFIVTTNEAKAPDVADGHQPRRNHYLASTPADVKALDVDEVDTHRDAEGRPVLYLSIDQWRIALYTIRIAEPGAGVPVTGGDSRWRVADGVRDRLSSDRAGAAARAVQSSEITVDDGDLYRVALARLVDRHALSNPAVEQVAELTDPPLPITEAAYGGIDRRVTAKAWAAAEQIDGPTGRRLLAAALLADAVSTAPVTVDEEDEEDGDLTYSEQFARRTLGESIAPPMSEAEFEALVDEAMAATDDETEESDE